jgi:hypothetical protein
LDSTVRFDPLGGFQDALTEHGKDVGFEPRLSIAFRYENRAFGILDRCVGRNHFHGHARRTPTPIANVMETITLCIWRNGAKRKPNASIKRQQWQELLNAIYGGETTITDLLGPKALTENQIERPKASKAEYQEHANRIASFDFCVGIAR